MRPVAQRAAFVSAVIGPVIGALFLFAPIQGHLLEHDHRDSRAAGRDPWSADHPSLGCGTKPHGNARPIFPMPFFAVLVWSLAPVLVYIGILLRLRGLRSTGTALVVTGLFLECTVLISFGAAPFFVPLVLLPLAITTTIALKRS